MTGLGKGESNGNLPQYAVHQEVKGKKKKKINTTFCRTNIYYAT